MPKRYRPWYVKKRWLISLAFLFGCAAGFIDTVIHWVA